MSAGSVEVEENGRALKVHTDTPHLVSLGGGRLSTAVTLHPLPEGRTTLGSGVEVDISLLGSGVEPVHCHIDNQAGTVTLVPVAEMTSIDNQRVSSPTRLTQGCMLCVGRSNFLRFNHPAEARLIKNSLPNSRISQLPFGFFPGEEMSVDGKPPSGSRRSWDSWEGLSSASSEEIARYISPKVFPAGSSTVNSPAALVLGPRAGQNKLSLAPLKLNGEHNARVESHNQKPVNVYQNVSPLPNGKFVPRDDSTYQTPVNRVCSPSPPPMSPLSPRNFSTPSPAFDRNPSYLLRKNVTSPTPGNHWGNGLEELSSRIGEAEAKRRQVECDRLLEQEAEKLERQRLDEILLMCADYEKQVQWERLNKPQQNRIITNGSLPRDKRLPSPNSPHFHQSFTYDSDSTPMSPDSEYKSCSSHEALDLSNPPPSSPRTRIKTRAGKDPPTPSREHALEVLENRLAILNDYEILGPPPPPRNSSKNIITPHEPANKPNTSNPASPSESTKNSSFSFETQNKLNNNNTGYKPGSIAEANAMSKYEFFGFNPRTNEVLNSQNYHNSTESLGSNTSKQRDSFQSASTQTSVTRSNTRIETDPFWTSADFMASNYNGDTIKRQEGKNGEYTTEQLIMQLDAIVRESMKTCNESNDREDMTPSPRSSERDSGIAETAVRDSAIETRDSEIETRDSDKFIMPLPENHLQMYSSLKLERANLVADLTALETKIMDIEQQEEELTRELEIERALVGSELEAQSEKLTGDEERVASLKERVAECEAEMDKCVSQQTERQNQVRRKVEQQQQVLISLEQKLHNCAKDSELRAELIESCKQQQDILEAERKAFEDLEFSLLEEEAWWLSRREELQREVSEAMTRCADRREKLASLQTQREQAIKHATSTTKLLEQQHAELMDSINKGRKRLNQIDAQLQNPTKTPKHQSDTEKKQSQDDLERISRVTSGAPMEMSSNSLGRRTIASLQEIERNRQLHLAKQGSLVIEEERKRVSELKRRVQDEARAEWEERRQREINCHSLNSVGSEESNLTSDLRTDSASSEDADKRLGNGVSRSQAEPSQGEDTTDQKEQGRTEKEKKENENEKEERQPESRPLSDVSTYSEDLLSVRLRVKNSTSIQRPLTRYLPIRGEALDLRQHIESAGHQVDLCPHVLLDKHSCRGFLHKLTSRFHHWNKRWFVFDRSRRTLTYFMDRSERKSRGGAYFQAIEEVYVDHSNAVKSPNPAVTFVIKSSERTYHLMAPSPEAMRIWVDVVFTGAEGYQEFTHGT